MIIKALLAITLISAALGDTNNSARIIGGTPTTVYDYPFVVAVLYETPEGLEQRCAGALISSWHVLSSAYCLDVLAIDQLQIRAGSTYSLTGGTVTGVSEVTIHPDYVKLPRYADIALVLLQEFLYIGYGIGLVYIPPQESYIPDGYPVRSVGWGLESEDGEPLQSLKAINTNIVAQDRCREAFADNDDVSIYDQVFCTHAVGVATCGDWGAPLVLGETLVGLQSHALCGGAAPDLFTRVDRHTGWILAHAVPPPRNRVPWDSSAYVQVVPPVLEHTE